MKITHTHTPSPWTWAMKVTKNKHISILPITISIPFFRLPCTCRCNSGWLEHHGLTQGTFSLEDLRTSAFNRWNRWLVRHRSIAEGGSTYNFPKRFGLEGFPGDFLGYFWWVIVELINDVIIHRSIWLQYPSSRILCLVLPINISQRCLKKNVWQHQPHPYHAS